MRGIFTILLMLWGVSLTAAEVRTLKGQVTAGGKGVAEVIVTDGENFTQTDEKGRYELRSGDENRLIYLTIPSGYTVEAVNSVPQFWQVIEPKKSRYDFELIKREKSDLKHGFVAIADPQIWHKKEFPALREGMADIRQTVEGYDIPFHGICCGDIISYDHTFYPAYNEIAATSGLTFFNTPGNHDMTLYGRSHETSTRLWEQTFGPVNYSMNIGKVHYVFLNDNFYIGRDYFYIGYLDERQLAWLERDLSYLPEGSTVILSIHIPTSCEPDDRKQFKYDNISNTMTNAPQLYRMLAPYKAHILSGHMHTTYNQEISDQLYEHALPALSGAWWQGPLCTDGTPRGYAVFEVEGEQGTWYYKSTGYTADHQMTIYQTPEGVLANVWDSDAKWQVEISFDGGAFGAMERKISYDPAARKMYASTEGFDHPYVYPSKADHFYLTAVPAGATQATVRAKDRFGRTYTQTLTLKNE